MPFKNSTGRRELEQELLQTKRILSQLEDEVEYETQAKMKAKEEAEKLNACLDEATKTKV